MVAEAQITAAAESLLDEFPDLNPLDQVVLQAVKRALEAAEKAAWQPASGDAPPLGQRVLLAQPGHEPRIGWLTEHGWDFGCSRCGTWVTHWRPLAASPTESA